MYIQRAIIQNLPGFSIQYPLLYNFFDNLTTNYPYFCRRIWKKQVSGIYFRCVLYLICIVMNTQTTLEPTALQSFMNSTIVTYGLKIIGAIAVILLLLFISKLIAGIVRRNIVKNADEKNKQAEKIAKLMGDITFYILVIFSFFIGFEMVGFNVGLIVGGISF